MTLLHSLSDFIELYLSIDLPQKEIELIKLRSYCELKNDDLLEQTVNSFRKAISSAQKHHAKFRTKSHYALPDPLEDVLHLSPEEFLLLVGTIRYGLTLDALSLILRLPIETIQFRVQHLRSNILLSDIEIKNKRCLIKKIIFRSKKRRTAKFSLTQTNI